MIVKSVDQLKRLAWELGKTLHGGECVELRGDVGAGKTTFAQGLAWGLGITAAVNSPSFTLEKSYIGSRDLTMHHYDFYRLEDPGIMRRTIAEGLTGEKNITVVEWADTVKDVLPPERIIVEIKYVADQPEWREINYDTGY